MSTVERARGGPEIEVVAKATPRRFTLEYKPKTVREADECKTPGRINRPKIPAPLQASPTNLPCPPAVPACSRWRLRLACRRALAVEARSG
jgi:hypothetical protein